MTITDAVVPNASIATYNLSVSCPAFCFVPCTAIASDYASLKSAGVSGGWCERWLFLPPPGRWPTCDVGASVPSNGYQKPTQKAAAQVISNPFVLRRHRCQCQSIRRTVVESLIDFAASMLI